MEEYKVYVLDLQRRVKYKIEGGSTPLILGRQKTFKLVDPRLSRNQLELSRSDKKNDFCIGKLIGKNPSVLKRSVNMKRILMKKDNEYTLFDGDEVSLLVTMFGFRVCVKKMKAADECSNYLFYKCKLASRPDEELIDGFHSKWFGAYDKLEFSHGFIQWLFPVFESSGMNFYSKKLKKREAALMRNDLEVANRLIKSYRLMLDFYGLQLLNEQTGEVGRAPNYEERYQNLANHYHNNLRITRILLSLGELGFRRYKKPLVDFLSSEIQNGLLQSCKDSLNAFWLPCLDENSPEYASKTKETPEDRTESIFFQKSNI